MEARTPHQFAKELIDKNYLILTDFNPHSSIDSRKYYAKECALINLDYMESIMLTVCESSGINEGCRSSFLLSVREEIKKYNGNSN